MGCCLSCATEILNIWQSGNTPDRRTRSGSGSRPSDASTGIKPAKVFTFRELASATENFRSQFFLGRGSLGCVYKGQLRNGQHVAVKLLDKNRQQGDKEFSAEVQMLSLMHHPNLVKLIGYCFERDERLLVYEYMPLGSLQHHLYDLPIDRKPLEWKKRMRIACGVAKGLEYLHDWGEQPVIFRDLKSSNILLDEDYHPKLSDLGMAKFCPLGDSSHVSTRVAETDGYCAPEYEATGHLTPKCDIYSLGVVLLELISGRKVIDKTRAPYMRHLVMWARPLFGDHNQFDKLVDPLLQGLFPLAGLYQAIAVAAMCLNEDADRRPEIREVVAILTYLESQPYDPNGPFPEFCRKETERKLRKKRQKKQVSQRGSKRFAAETGTARETPGNPDVDTRTAVEETE